LDLVKQDHNKFSIVDNEKIQSAIENMFTQSFSNSDNNNNDIFTSSFSKTLKDNNQVQINPNDEISNMFTMSLSKSIYGDTSNRFSYDVTPMANDDKKNITDIIQNQDNNVKQVESLNKTNSTNSTNLEFENQFNNLYNDIMQMIAIKSQMQNNVFLPEVTNQPQQIQPQNTVNIQTPSITATPIPSQQTNEDSENFKQLLQQFNNYK
jgi:hypothetical protein